MAGHNKWSKVKHIKAVVDAKRGKVFSKLSKELTIAARLAGSNPDLNARLRSAILAARAQNMPHDNVERAIKKGAGELDGAALEEVLYEAYGPGGVAFLIEVVTDNRNRALGDLKTLLHKNEGIFADPGSVAYLFQRRGEIRLEKDALDEDRVMELALQCGADDVSGDHDEWIVHTSVEQLFAVSQELQSRNAQPLSARLTFQPTSTIAIEDPAVAQAVLKLHDVLDDYDDSQHVHSNFEIAEDLVTAPA